MGGRGSSSASAGRRAASAPQMTPAQQAQGLAQAAAQGAAPPPQFDYRSERHCSKITVCLYDSETRTEHIFESFSTLDDIVSILDCMLEPYADWNKISACFYDERDTLVAYMESCDSPDRLTLA